MKNQTENIEVLTNPEELTVGKLYMFINPSGEYQETITFFHPRYSYNGFWSTYYFESPLVFLGSTKKVVNFLFPDGEIKAIDAITIINYTNTGIYLVDAK